MINDVALKICFPSEAVNFFNECFYKCKNTDGIMDLFLEAEESFFTSEEHEYKEILQTVSEKTGINRYSIDMLFLLLSSERLHNNFKSRGYSDQLFYELMYDLQYKLYECKKLHGVWGTFVLQWFRNGYRLKRFKIGRLQYQLSICPVDDYKGIIKKGEPTFDVHIPSSGSLNFQDVCNSLREAYRFFESMLRNGKLILFCESWLLYEPLFKNYNEESNIKKFYNLFDIIKNIDDPQNSDFWRVFDVEYSKEALYNVTADNSLKKLILNHLKSGGTFGEGIGILVVDKDF